MPTVTPRHTRRWAVRVLYVTVPLTVLCLMFWLFQWPLSSNHSPPVMFVLYQLLAMISMCAGIVAVVAAGQIAVAKAFTVGYMSGVQAGLSGKGDEDPPKHRGRSSLRAVE
jgi:hypothetical protein